MTDSPLSDLPPLPPKWSEQAGPNLKPWITPPPPLCWVPFARSEGTLGEALGGVVLARLDDRWINIETGREFEGHPFTDYIGAVRLSAGRLCGSCARPVTGGRAWWHHRLGVFIHDECPLTNVCGEDVSGHCMTSVEWSTPQQDAQ